MEEHPIEGLMITAMNSIQDMVDVNTIIGEPIETSNNIVIIPISKVGFGFAAGGSEFRGEAIDEYTKKDKEEEIQYRLPFGGGSGAGVSITPVAFLVVQQNTVKLLPVSHSSAIDKLMDYVPDLIEKANNVLNKTMQNKKEEKNQKRQDEKQEQKQREKELEKLQNIANTKARPRRSNQRTKPETTYEIEYDETIPIDEIENVEYIDKEEYDD